MAAKREHGFPVPPPFLVLTRLPVNCQVFCARVMLCIILWQLLTFVLLRPTLHVCCTYPPVPRASIRMV